MAKIPWEVSVGNAPVLTVAAAATIDLGALDSNVISVTGTASVSNFGTETDVTKIIIWPAGVTLINLAGGVGQLRLRGNANRVTAVNDISTFMSINGIWIEESYNPATVDLSKLEESVLGPFRGLIMWSSWGIPPGFLECNGAYLHSSTYLNLFSKIGYYYGAFPPYFALPDLRGLFVRAVDNGRGIDAGRPLGSFQYMDIQAHAHQYYEPFRYFPDGGSQVGMNYYSGVNVSGALMNLPTTTYVGGAETRPHNLALIAVIKY